jgi:hypothetical protein
MKFLTAIILAVTSSASFANSVTIDFQSLESPSSFNINVASSYSEDGYTLTTPGMFRSWGTSSADYRGSTALFSANSASSISNVGAGNVSLIKSDNSVFDLISIDLFGQLINPPFFSDGSDPVDAMFTGYKADGSFVYQSFFNDSTSPTTFLLTNFSNLIRVDWTNSPSLTANQFDNIVLSTSNVSAVPVPAAAWLFCSAIMGFIGFRRKA